MCLIMVVVISLVHQQCMHPTELTWHFRCSVVLCCRVIHWLHVVVVMHQLWQCSGGGHEIPVILWEHHPCSQSIRMNYRSDRNQGMTWRWLQRAWGDLCTTSAAGVIPVHRQGLMQPRAGCSTPLLYCGLHWCLLALSSRVQWSMRWEAYSQSHEFCVKCSPGHLKQTLHNPASFDIMLHLYSDSAPIVWYHFSSNLVSRGGKRGCLGCQGTPPMHLCKDSPVLSWAYMQTGMVVAFLQSTGPQP